ncbi:hypothetical protein HK102_010616 [Quaeritorhiza haematococci]|nr:hypothetical protein HK102_010616 [Quaeritorhiza haematococci]
MYDDSAQDLRVRRQISNFFESYINSQTPDETEIRRIFDIITRIAHQHGFSVEKAGSRSKRNAIERYSDTDLWIDTHGRVVSSQFRQLFVGQVIHSLKNAGFDVDNEAIFKPTATKVSTATHDFDIVFSDGDWVHDSGVVRPNNSDFSNKPYRQRAVKALKLLARKNPIQFPRMGGIVFERLVLFAAREVDAQYKDHIEFDSGLLLFRTVLFHFVFASGLRDLVEKVDAAVPKPSQAYEWKLSTDVFDRWKCAAAYFLATLHEIRTSGRVGIKTVPAVDVQNVFMLPRRLDRATKIDEKARVVFVE